MKNASILTAAQMRSAEQAAIVVGVPEYELMERAGAAAAEIVWRVGGKRDLLVLCGPGNNGGDGFVIARLLRDRGVQVRVAVTGDSRTASSIRARAAWNGPVEPLEAAVPASQLVDALFGTGLSRGLDGAVARKLSSLTNAAEYSYAVDLPSGVDTDSGALLSPVPRFGLCIALGALKPAHALHPAAGLCRRTIVADIGIEPPSTVQLLAPAELYAPDWSAHKYSRGLVAVVGGQMGGAARLAAMAAARSGAGMVRHMPVSSVAEPLDAIVSVHTEDARALTSLLRDDRLAAILVGPGLGRDAAAQDRLDVVLGCGRALVLDADALTLIAERGLGDIPNGSILTPHEGEFRRLFAELPGSKIDRAVEAACRSGAVVIYKGPDTVIAAPDGRAVVSGAVSSWLSTAGTGDVLAGLVAGRLAVDGDAFRAACEAVWLHGEAARRSGAAFAADDLIVELPAAIASRL